jgi:hypothetical protein
MEDGFRRGVGGARWGDIGLVYVMSKGIEIRRPTDLRGRHPRRGATNRRPDFFQLVGQVTLPLDPTEVPPRPNRHGGQLAAPALAAEQLQWTPYLDHINEQVIVAAIGATLMKKSRLDALAADTRDMLRQRRVSRVESERIRKLDIEARTVEAKMTVVHLSDDDRVSGTASS